MHVQRASWSLTGRLRRPFHLRPIARADRERMTEMEGTRQYDLGLFGGTGFTGGLTADYLAAHAPAEMRWALAGRNRTKLEAVAARLAAMAPEAPKPDVLVADAADEAVLREIAEKTRVVITTVGPY